MNISEAVELQMEIIRDCKQRMQSHDNWYAYNEVLKGYIKSCETAIQVMQEHEKAEAVLPDKHPIRDSSPLYDVPLAINNTLDEVRPIVAKIIAERDEARKEIGSEEKYIKDLEQSIAKLQTKCAELEAENERMKEKLKELYKQEYPADMKYFEGDFERFLNQ